MVLIGKKIQLSIILVSIGENIIVYYFGLNWRKYNCQLFWSQLEKIQLSIIFVSIGENIIYNYFPGIKSPLQKKYNCGLFSINCFNCKEIILFRNCNCRCKEDWDHISHCLPWWASCIFIYFYFYFFYSHCLPWRASVFFVKSWFCFQKLLWHNNFALAYFQFIS